MRKKNGLYRFMLLLFLCFVSVIAQNNIFNNAKYNRLKNMNVTDDYYRDYFFADELFEKKDYLSEECKTILTHVENDVSYYPIPESTVDKSLKTSYINSWMSERSYGGKRGHEGVDIMASKNKRGIYPVVSMTDGVITNLGWLEKGGYRVGITAKSGTYYYYAHLESYANIKEGEEVRAGDLLGYMGDSGYGEEGTTGKFAVHLHVGIYCYQDGEEISLNPYYVLKALENKKLKYAYS